MLISSSVYPQFILCLKQAALAHVPLLLFPTVLQRTFRCCREHLGATECIYLDHQGDIFKDFSLNWWFFFFLTKMNTLVGMAH